MREVHSRFTTYLQYFMNSLLHLVLRFQVQVWSYVKVRQQASSQVKIFVVYITLTPAFVNLDFRVR